MGLVDDLIGNDQVARLELVAQRTHRARGDDVGHAQLLERIDIGAEWEHGWG